MSVHHLLSIKRLLQLNPFEVDPVFHSHVSQFSVEVSCLRKSPILHLGEGDSAVHLKAIRANDVDEIRLMDLNFPIPFALHLLHPLSQSV